MASRLLCHIAIFVVYVTIYFHLVALVLATETFGLKQQGVLVDCRRQDYRSFVKCLRRQKRHHCQDYGLECWVPCVTTCEREPDCNRDCCQCTKNTTQDSVNVLTQITLHNNIAGFTTCCPTCQVPVPCPSTSHSTIVTTPSPTDITTPSPTNVTTPSPTNVTTPSPTNVTTPRPTGLTVVTCPHCPYCIYCPPVVQMRCTYPYQWLCIYPTWKYQRPRVDCSACTVPYYYYKCDVSCYGTQGSYGVYGAHRGYGTYGAQYGYGTYGPQWGYGTYGAHTGYGYYKK